MSNHEIALRCLAAIPNADADYHTWVSTGMALHATDTGLLEAWDAWSRGSGKYTPGECARCWAHFSTAGRTESWGLGTLVYRARRSGTDPFPKPKPRKPKPRRRVDQTPAHRPPDIVRTSIPFPAERSAVPATPTGGRGEP